MLDFKEKAEGFGLLEVLIATVALAIFAILIGQFSGNYVRTEKRIAGSASCQQRILGISSTLKMLDNSLFKSSWLPGKVAPDQWDENAVPRTDSHGYAWSTTNPRMRGPVMGAWSNGSIYPSGPASGSWVFVAPSAIHTMNGLEKSEELAQWNNTWQLRDSAATYLGMAYIRDPNYCTTDGVEITNDPFFRQVLNKAGASLRGEKVFLKIQRINLANGSLDCGALQPIPLNGNSAPGAGAPAAAQIRINHSYGYKATLRLEYQEIPSNDLRACQSNISVSVGSDFIPPEVRNLRIESPSLLDPGQRNIICATGSVGNVVLSFSSVEKGTSRVEEAVSYACRLDYGYRGALRATSGWVPCINFDVAIPSLPSIQARLTSVQDQGANLIRYSLSGLREGNYAFHVKAFDSARNQSALATLNFAVDLSRPVAVSVSPPSQIRPFATGVGDGHVLVDTNPATAPWINAVRTQLNAASPLYQCTQGSFQWVASFTEPMEISRQRASWTSSTGATAPCGNTRFGISVSQSGRYSVTARGCDECGDGSGNATRTWVADLAPTPNVTDITGPIYSANRLVPRFTFGGASVKGDFVVGAVGDLPHAYTCEQYTGGTATWNALLAGGGNSPVVNCDESNWPTTINNSCKNKVAAGAGFCSLAIDGCGRSDKMGAVPYQVRGTSQASLHDVCADVACEPNKYCRTRDSAGNPILNWTQVVCLDASDIHWYGAGRTTNLNACPDGSLSCECFANTDCTNDVGAASCPAGAGNFCDPVTVGCPLPTSGSNPFTLPKISCGIASLAEQGPGIRADCNWIKATCYNGFSNVPFNPLGTPPGTYKLPNACKAEPKFCQLPLDGKSGGLITPASRECPNLNASCTSCTGCCANTNPLDPTCCTCDDPANHALGSVYANSCGGMNCVGTATCPCDGQRYSSGTAAANFASCSAMYTQCDLIPGAACNGSYCGTGCPRIEAAVPDAATCALYGVRCHINGSAFCASGCQNGAQYFPVLSACQAVNTACTPGLAGGYCANGCPLGSISLATCSGVSGCTTVVTELGNLYCAAPPPSPTPSPSPVPTATATPTPTATPVPTATPAGTFYCFRPSGASGNEGSCSGRQFMCDQYNAERADIAAMWDGRPCSAGDIGPTIWGCVDCTVGVAAGEECFCNIP